MQDFSSLSETAATSRQATLQEMIVRTLKDLDHVLPGQAPILDFVHHNTLHGFQHLPFEEALAEAERLTGIAGYQPESHFRDYYRQGRLNDADLWDGLRQYAEFDLDGAVCEWPGRSVRRGEIYRLALLFDLESVSESRLNWNIEELGALEKLQPDVPAHVKARLLGAKPSGGDEKQRVGRLWTCLLDKLELDESLLHPENLLDLSPEQAEEWIGIALKAQDGNTTLHELMREEAGADLSRCLSEIGDSLTLGGLVKAITGVDVLEILKPQLIRACASALDEGVAPWTLPERQTQGFYAGWRSTFRYDADPVYLELPDWAGLVNSLPNDPVAAIIEQLDYLDLPEARWPGYLRRLALELPGWAGMINWRHQHPGYRAASPAEVGLADFLAIRLIYDRLWLGQICRDIWKIEARIPALESYFRKNLSEWMVRQMLYRGELPEFLAQKAKTLILRARSERNFRPEWQALSDQIRTWQLSPLSRRPDRHTPWTSGWRLFRLFQHLGFGAETVEAMPKADLEALLKQLDAFKPAQRSKVWLAAYERNYREALFGALCANREDTGPNSARPPEAQLVFCMDEREESLRRHLEEVFPGAETFGAAGFFGIPMFYRGFDEAHATPLCPVVVTPAHRVEEILRPGAEAVLPAHRRGYRLLSGLTYLSQHRLRIEPSFAYLTILLSAPFTLLALLGDMLWPNANARLAKTLQSAADPGVPTVLAFSDADVADSTSGLSGFSDAEQAARVENLLRAIGLTADFAPLICLVAHGSTSLNNPHEAAHECGACGGRKGGPNARVFAAMANRPEVRRLLAERGIAIPEASWFVGAQHDTCSDLMTWYDLQALPRNLEAQFTRLSRHIAEAQRRSAQERCRRFLPAGETLPPLQAFEHVQRRAGDLSQVRPEFGHASNACAIIGRRALTRGLYLDRRPFLISYDPAHDEDGSIVESILLTAGPVGAGINLEYYFSTVDNDRFGCGTKIPHNVTGLFGVMEGTGGDLRTGLPKQMVEIHEAMRLLVVVEARTAVLEAIYARQPALRELVANGWIHLAAIDPETGAIALFERDSLCFVPWRAHGRMPARVENSLAAFQGETGPVAPVLIRPRAAGA